MNFIKIIIFALVAYLVIKAVQVYRLFSKARQNSRMNTNRPQQTNKENRVEKKDIIDAEFEDITNSSDENGK